MSKEGTHFRKHAIKTKYGIDRVVEDLIQESMSKGDFNNLNGSGKPLSSAQSQSLYLDFTTHKLNRIMLDNGFIPEWITLSKEIRDARLQLLLKVRQERVYYGDWPLQLPDEQAAWQRFSLDHEHEVQELNKLIDKYNLIVPILKNQFFRYRLDREAPIVFKETDLKRNQPRPAAQCKAKDRQSEKAFKSLLSDLISRLL